jgi:hypothetical protein
MAKDFSSLVAWFDSLPTDVKASISMNVSFRAHTEGRNATDEDYRSAFTRKYLKQCEAKGFEPTGLEEDIPGLADYTED